MQYWLCLFGLNEKLVFTCFFFEKQNTKDYDFSYGILQLLISSSCYFYPYLEAKLNGYFVSLDEKLELNFAVPYLLCEQQEATERIRTSNDQWF